jgi:hypothetical protein
MPADAMAEQSGEGGPEMCQPTGHGGTIPFNGV